MANIDIVQFANVEFKSDLDDNIACSITTTGGTPEWYRDDGGATIDDTEIVAGDAWDPEGSEETFILRCAQLALITELTFINCQLTEFEIEKLYNFSSLNKLYLSNDAVTGTLAFSLQELFSYIANPQITYLWLSKNSITGTIMGISNFNKLQQLYINNNSIGGTIYAELKHCSAMTKFSAGTCEFDAYEDGAFTTQTLLTTLSLIGNDITSEAHIDNILSDLVINEAAGDSGRDCTVDLSGGTNHAPGVAGDADVITLTGKGWTVTTN